MKRLDLTRVKFDEGKLYPFIMDAEQVRHHWETFEPLIAASVEHSNGTVTVESIRGMLFNDQARLLGTSRGDGPEIIVVMRMIKYETYTSARVIAFAGHNLRDSMQFFSTLETWSFEQGAVEIEGWTRPAIVRLMRRYGWKPKVTIVTYDLRRKLQ